LEISTSKIFNFLFSSVPIFYPPAFYSNPSFIGFPKIFHPSNYSVLHNTQAHLQYIILINLSHYYMYSCLVCRPVAMGWQMLPLDSGMPAFCQHWELFPLFCCCFICAAKERSREILVELNLHLCGILESSIFSCTHIIHSIVIK